MGLFNWSSIVSCLHFAIYLLPSDHKMGHEPIWARERNVCEKDYSTQGLANALVVLDQWNQDETLTTGQSNKRKSLAPRNNRQWLPEMSVLDCMLSTILFIIHKLWNNCIVWTVSVSGNRWIGDPGSEKWIMLYRSAGDQHTKGIGFIETKTYLMLLWLFNLLWDSLLFSHG